MEQMVRAFVEIGWPMVLVLALAGGGMLVASIRYYLANPRIEESDFSKMAEMDTSGGPTPWRFALLGFQGAMILVFVLVISALKLKA